MIKLFSMPRGMLMDASVQAFLKFSRKCPCGSAEKPVGLVWFGLASPSGTVTEKKIFPGDRDAVRTAAIEHALQLLLKATDVETT